MSFIDNIKQCICAEDFPSPPSFRAVMFGDRAIYLENVCTIISYTKDEVRLSLKKGGLNVKGKELYIKKYCQGDVVICGKISSLERV